MVFPAGSIAQIRCGQPFFLDKLQGYLYES